MSCSRCNSWARVLAAGLLFSAAGLLATASTSAAQALSIRIDSSRSSVADAAEHGDRAKLAQLLQEGVDVNAPQADGMTALHWATYHDDVKAANRYGVTPLSLACTNGNAAIVDVLLNAGADPNGQLPGGETPLMTAARTGALPVVKTLL